LKLFHWANVVEEGRDFTTEKDDAPVKTTRKLSREDLKKKCKIKSSKACNVKTKS